MNNKEILVGAKLEVAIANFSMGQNRFAEEEPRGDSVNHFATVSNSVSLMQ